MQSSGEDWYLLEGNTASANVYAVADGAVAFAGSEYPGLVVIVRHADVLYSMYGHLDEDLAVAEGDAVPRGQFLGRVLDRTDGRAPSHLHFEKRTFLTTPEVNGSSPRYDVGCGFECAPGPDYLPIDAPEHPSAMGWRNPTHVIARRAYPGFIPDGTEVVVAGGASNTIALWSLPSDRADGVQIGDAPVAARERFHLTAVATGHENSTRTSADAYRLWLRLALLGSDAWVRAAVPSTGDSGSDGRPSSVRFQFLPAISAT